MKIRELAAPYLRSGLYSFGASANEVLHEQLVEKRAYLTDAEYIRMMSLGALVPGPFHVNLVIATGYAIGGVRGALVAVGSFIIPGFLIAASLIIALETIPAAEWVTKFPGIASGMLAAVAGLVISVVLKLARKNMLSATHKILTIAISCLVFYFHLPFITVIIATGITFLLIALAEKWRRR